MSYINTHKRDETDEDRLKNSTPQTSGGSGLFATGPTAMEGSSKAPSGTKGSGVFTNLNNYLDANKEQAESMGSKLASNVQSSVQDASSALTGAEGDFGNQVIAGTQQANRDLQTQIGKDPTQVDKDAFSKQISGYKGPTDITATDAWKDAVGKVSKANQNVVNTRDDAGRTVLLNDAYGAASGKNRYTGGEQKLDQLLVQRAPGAQQKLGALMNQDASLNSTRQNALDSSVAEIGIGQKSSDDAKTGALNAVTRSSAALDAEIQKRVLAAKAARDTAWADPGRAGVVPKTDTYNYGLNPYAKDANGNWQFLRQGDEATAANIASKDEYGKMLRLQELAALGGKTAAEAAKYTDTNKAGTFSATPTANDAAYKAAAAQRGEEFLNAYKIHNADNYLSQDVNTPQQALERARKEQAEISKTADRLRPLVPNSDGLSDFEVLQAGQLTREYNPYRTGENVGVWAKNFMERLGGYGLGDDLNLHRSAGAPPIQGTDPGVPPQVPGNGTIPAPPVPGAPGNGGEKAPPPKKPPPGSAPPIEVNPPSAPPDNTLPEEEGDPTRPVGDGTPTPPVPPSTPTPPAPTPPPRGSIPSPGDDGDVATPIGLRKPNPASPTTGPAPGAPTGGNFPSFHEPEPTPPPRGNTPPPADTRTALERFLDEQKKKETTDPRNQPAPAVTTPEQYDAYMLNMYGPDWRSIPGALAGRPAPAPVAGGGVGQPTRQARPSAPSGSGDAEYVPSPPKAPPAGTNTMANNALWNNSQLLQQLINPRRFGPVPPPPLEDDNS